MNHNSASSIVLALMMLKRNIVRPGWLILLFFFLICMIPFTGRIQPYGSEPKQIIDPFSLSLLIPSPNPFGPYEMLTLAMIFIIPAAIADWRQWASSTIELSSGLKIPVSSYPLAGLMLYTLFAIASLPFLARSISFQGATALVMTFVDIILRATIIAWIVDFAMKIYPYPRYQILVGFMIGGAVHLAISFSDYYLIYPKAKQLIETDWALIFWHGIIAFAVLTLHAIPVRLRNNINLW